MMHACPVHDHDPGALPGPQCTEAELRLLASDEMAPDSSDRVVESADPVEDVGAKRHAAAKPVPRGSTAGHPAERAAHHPEELLGEPGRPLACHSGRGSPPAAITPGSARGGGADARLARSRQTGRAVVRNDPDVMRQARGEPLFELTVVIDHENRLRGRP
jgi:hypothetical protein